MGADEVARSLGMSMSKLSRMENGQRGLYADDVAALLGLYRVPAARREELLHLVRNGQQRNWWQVQDGRLPAMWEDLMHFEAEAAVINNYETMFIPGLLQTEGYMRALAFGLNNDLSEVEVDQMVVARIGRQAILSNNRTPSLRVVVEETVLRRPVGEPGVIYRQVRHLMDSAAQRHVVIQLVPLSLGAHLGLDGPFVVLEFEGQPSLLFMELRGNFAFVEDPVHVGASKQALRRLRAVRSPQMIRSNSWKA